MIDEILVCYCITRLVHIIQNVIKNFPFYYQLIKPLNNNSFFL